MRILVLLVVVAALSSCAHGPRGEPSTSAPQGEAGAETESAAVPETPAGEKLSWFMKKINEERGALTPEEAEENFSQSFLAQVPAAHLVDTFGQIAAGLAPLKLQSVAEQSSQALVANVATAQGPARVDLQVEPEAPHKIMGLLIRPQQ